MRRPGPLAHCVTVLAFAVISLVSPHPSPLTGLEAIDEVVREAIANGDCPGAVVLVSHQFKPVWFKAYGNRQLQPTPEPMTTDTIFDMASLTKVMATATSVMILIDQGKVSLTDPVSKYLPEFGQHGKETITIEQLLRHRGGLIPDNPLRDYQNGPEVAWKRICKLQPVVPPGERFIYTDVGYIVLGKLVEAVSGVSLDEFARRHIFEPLKMADTSFCPEDVKRCAPCDQRNGKWIRGEVHDPRAYLLGGVAGHAGLFSTAQDTATFAHMILNKGTWGGARVLSSKAVEQMVSPGATPPGQMRGLGWDIDTPFSGPRGDCFPVGGVGHTGFTGTSLWIDLKSQTVVIVLTNRLHPDGKGDVRPLRRKIANIVANAVGYQCGKKP